MDSKRAKCTESPFPGKNGRQPSKTVTLTFTVERQNSGKPTKIDNLVYDSDSDDDTAPTAEMTMSDSDDSSLSDDEFPTAKPKHYTDRRTRKQHEQLEITENLKLPQDLQIEYVSSDNPPITADDIDITQKSNPTFDKDGDIIKIVGHRTRDGAIELQLLMDSGETMYEKLHRMKQDYPLPTAEYIIQNLRYSPSNSRQIT